MSFRSAMSWGAVQSVLRLLIGFVSIKVTAVFLGPSGLALVGQINNFLTFAQGGVGSALQTGIVKMTAEAAGDTDRQRAVWKIGILLTLAISIPLGIAVAIFSSQISSWLFQSDSYQSVVLLAAPCLTLIVLTYVLNGILNGLQLRGRLSLAQIAAMLLSALIFIPSAYFGGVTGALFGSVIALASGALITAPFMPGEKFADLRNGWNAKFDGKVMKQMLGFFPMLMVNSAIPPLSLICIRDLVAGDLGLSAAGNWQASWRLSEMYLLVLTTGISMYLMPHLSIKRSEAESASELRRACLLVGLTAAAFSIPLILMRDLVVQILFTKEFSAVSELILWQLGGDILRMAVWPLRMTLVIRQESRSYIFLELLMPALHLAGVYLLLPTQGLNAVVISYVISIVICNLILAFRFRSVLIPRRESGINK